MLASSTMTTHPCGSGSRRVRSISAWMVLDEMSAPSARRSAATPDGAAPRTSIPLALRVSLTARLAVVLPVPASPTTHTTRSGVSHAWRTIRRCSSESQSGGSAAATGAPAPRPCSAISSARRSSRMISRVVRRCGTPGVGSASICSTVGSSVMRAASSRTCVASAPRGSAWAQRWTISASLKTAACAVSPSGPMSDIAAARSSASVGSR